MFETPGSYATPPTLSCLAWLHCFIQLFVLHCNTMHAKHLVVTKKHFHCSIFQNLSIFFSSIAHLSSPWSIGWVAVSFLVRPSIRPAMVTSDQISTFFNIYRHKSVVLTQFHLISSSTKLHWPSTTKYQQVPPSTDPVPLSTNQYCPVLTQHHNISTSPILYWPSTTKYQPVPPHTDPVPPNTNQHRLLLSQYYHVSTSSASY